MRYLFIICALFVLPHLVWAQEEDDEGYLTNLIEDKLSGVGSEVNVVGFQGALSSEATIEQMTIADSEGIWLTLEDLVLSWNRTAILRGQIDVKELSAGRIVVARSPVSEESTPSPEAESFSLPELPVSILLEELNIARIELAEEFLGEEIAVSLIGNAELAGGSGAANVVAERLGGKAGRFAIDASYANDTNVLGLNLTLDEEADGITSRLLDLPDRPSVGLVIEGTAPLDSYEATLSLASDGQERVTGTFGLTSADGDRTIDLNISGDVAPLIAPDYRDFFGENVRLAAQAQQLADGGFDISRFNLNARRLLLTGSLRLDGANWPTYMRLRGGIAHADGDPVLLPISGADTYVDSARVGIDYDASASDDWTANIDVQGFERPGLAMDTISLNGGGIITQGEGAGIGQATAGLQYAATGLALDDAGAAEAFGDTISGVFEAQRIEAEPTTIDRFTLTGPGLEMAAEAQIASSDDGFRTQSTIALTAEEIDRFSTLVGQDLGGSASLSILADITPLDGLYNLLFTGQTTNLAVGIDEVDAVLQGSGSLSANAVRDAEGTRLEAFRIKTDAAEITANADITSDTSDASFTANLTDVGLVLDDLSGPATVTGTANRNAEGVVDFDIDGTGPSISLQAAGDVTTLDEGQRIAADLTADITDLNTYDALTGQDLNGAADLTLQGVLTTNDLVFEGDVRAQTQDLGVGISQLDPLIDGTGTITASLARGADNQLSLSDLVVRTDDLSLDASADYAMDGPATADIDLRIPDAAVLDGRLSGPITLQADAARGVDEVTNATIVATGPSADLNADLVIDTPENGYEISGDVDALISRLQPYGAIAGQTIGGSVTLDLSGAVMPDLSAFSADAAVRTQDISIGNTSVDPLLRGSGQLDVNASYDGETLNVSEFRATTPNVTLSGTLDGRGGAGRGQFDARLRDVGLFTDQLSGAATATGTASLDASGNWGIDATGTGPGGITAQASGQVASSNNLDLQLTGSVPLALANGAIDPRRLNGTANFDIGINGPAELSSVSGQITIPQARLAAPTLEQALENINGTITLQNEAAQIDMNAGVSAGGSLAITGPVGLTAPYQADVNVALNNVVVEDPELYETTANGAIGLQGPLQGGAQITGEINLGQVDIQVPSSSVSTLGELPDVTHVGASGAITQTLDRAGVGASDDDDGSSSGSSAGFGLDIDINAPSRIFIRGRGLDAELGGSLNIGGTTNNVIPVGRFELVRGRLDILQQRFEFTEGSATLQGDFDPYIRLVAETETESGTVIDIIVEGPAGEPDINFESSPELPQDEVLSQLIFGRDLSSLSPLQAVQLASAISTLAGKGGGALDSLRSNIGLDDFDVTTDDDGNAALRAGKYLSENVYTDVTINSEGDTEINLNLDVTDEITAKGTVDQEGDSSLGVFFERDY